MATGTILTHGVMAQLVRISVAMEIVGSPIPLRLTFFSKYHVCVYTFYFLCINVCMYVCIYWTCAMNSTHMIHACNVYHSFQIGGGG